MKLRKLVRTIDLKHWVTVLMLLFTTGCMVNNHVVLRLDDVVAFSNGKTNSQMKKKIISHLADFESARTAKQYKKALAVLISVAADIEKTYMIINDDTASYRSPAVFTPRTIKRENVTEQNRLLADLYMNCLLNAVRYCLVVQDLDGYYRWFEKLTTPSPLTSHIRDYEPQINELVNFCLKAGYLYFSECRIDAPIKIIEILKKEIDLLIPGSLERTRTNHKINFILAVCYLHAGDLAKAEDAVKYTVSHTQDTKLKIRSLLLLCTIKDNRQELHFARLYMEKALSILRAEPTRKNVITFLETLTPETVHKHLTPPKWLLTAVVSIMLNQSMADTIGQEYFVKRNPYLNAAELFQNAGDDNMFNTFLSKYEADAHGRMVDVKDAADYAKILVNQKKWKKILDTFWGQIDILEYYNHKLSDIRYARSVFQNLSIIFDGLALSIAMADIETVNAITVDSWPVSLGRNTLNKDEITLKLMQLSKSKGLLSSLLRSNGQQESSKRQKVKLEKLQEMEAQAFSEMIVGDATAQRLDDLQTQEIANWKEVHRTAIKANTSGNAVYLSSLDSKDVVLSSSEALIEYHIIEDLVVVSMLKNNKLTISTLNIGYEALERLIDQFYKACSTPTDQLATNTEMRLYAELINVLPEDLSNVESIYIAPDKAIGRIPFELLFEMSDNRLLADKKIAYVPSLSVMQLMRAQQRQKGNKIIAMMGDPLPLDVRKALSYSGQGSSGFVAALGDVSIKSKKLNFLVNSKTMASAASFDFDLKYGIFNRIPFTAEEIKAIKKIAEANKWDTEILLAEEFTKTNVSDLLNKNPYYVHFATHAIISYEIPYIMEPSLFVSAFDRPIDHFLQADEIEKMNLTGTELVVLSACKTGIDASYDNEGVSGLAKSFLIAGAQNVIVTLWSIDDKATCVFMTHFYNALFKGQSIRLALTNAKTKMIQQDSYQHPYYWAGFVLYGSKY